MATTARTPEHSMIEVFKIIARNAMLDEDWFHFCIENKIRFSDFPDRGLRDALLEFTAIKEKNNFTYACHKMIDFTDSIKVDPMAPRDKETILMAYKETMLDFHAKNLASSVSINPKDVYKHIDAFLKKVPEEILEHNFVKDITSLYEVTKQNAANDEPIKIIPGWERFSVLVGGFNAQRVGMIMAKTGFGKTTLCVNLALNACEKNPVVYFNMEMGRQDFFEKAIMAATKMSFRDIKFEPSQNEYKVSEVQVRLKDKKFYYTDGRPSGIEKIESILRRRRDEKIGFVFIDYDQKIALNISKETPEWKALQLAVEHLERIAKEYNVFIFLLAQENETGDVAASKRSKNPATFVARFFSQTFDDEERYFIQANKNRFGPTGDVVEIIHKPEIALVKEADKKIISKKEFSNMVDFEHKKQQEQFKKEKKNDVFERSKGTFGYS